jgi:hypothetical protein
MKARRRAGIAAALVLAAPVGLLAWLTYRVIRHESLDRNLITAIKEGDDVSIKALLNRGASGAGGRRISAAIQGRT